MRMKSFFSLLLAFFLLFSLFVNTQALADTSQPEKVATALFEGRSYAIMEGQMTWTAAKALCEEMGGHLATITSAEEQALINKLNKERRQLWIGGYREEGNTFRWVTGEDWVYTNWGDGQPNNSTNVISNENCVSVWPQKWNDLNDASREQSGFIIEWEKPAQAQTKTEQELSLIGTSFTLGTYPQGANGEVEPIEWTVLTVQDGNALLLSRYALDAKVFHSVDKPAIWNNSTLASWLCKDFFNTAFTAEEQSAILSTYPQIRDPYVPNSNRFSKEGPYKVFLLSKGEIAEFFGIQEVIDRFGLADRTILDPAAVAELTPYAVVAGAQVTGKSSSGAPVGWWWLRQWNEKTGYMIMRVDSNCKITSNFFNWLGGAVRPSVWIGVDDLKALSGRQPTVAPLQDEEEEDLSALVPIGSSVTFGRYPQSSDDERNLEPIEWIILDAKGSKALLLSKYILDAYYYNRSSRQDLTGITWETSELRKELNSTFLNTAFSADEQAAIALTKVSNSPLQGSPNWIADDGRDTQDQIFLLSYAEAMDYFQIDPDVYANTKASAIVTPYAYSHEAFLYKTYINGIKYNVGLWWLRSAGITPTEAAFMSQLGHISSMDVGNMRIGIRPAMWVDITVLDFSSVETPAITETPVITEVPSTPVPTSAPVITQAPAASPVPTQTPASAPAVTQAPIITQVPVMTPTPAPADETKSALQDPCYLPDAQSVQLASGQKPAVYSAPSKNAVRAQKSKAVCKTSGTVAVFGQIDGWLMVQYHTDDGVTRVGYVEKNGFKESVDAPALSFSARVASMASDAALYESFDTKSSRLGDLKAGTELTYLATYGDWAYVETIISKKTARGFIPRDSVIIAGQGTKVSVASAFASANLDKYPASAMINGKLDDSWQFKNPGASLSSIYADFYFDQPQDLEYMIIWNGFWKVTNNNDQYTRNGRLEKVEISFLYLDSQSYTDPITMTIPEMKDWKTRSFGACINLTGHDAVISVRIRPLSVRKGSKFPKDICVSEVAFYAR